jgi:hypothetical protein
MIKYSKRALKAITFLFRPYNDIDIFVEDSTCHNMWELLLNKVLGDRPRVIRIFPLGGKKEVLKACESDQGKSNRPKLYIIDGDLDFVVGKGPPSCKYLYRLNAYNVENLLFSETALIEIAFECMPDLPRVEVQKSLAFKKVRNELVRKCRPLFVIYGAAFLLNPDFEPKTAAYNIMKLSVQKGSRVEISQEKVENRIKDLTARLQENHTKREIAKAKAIVSARIPRNQSQAHLFISGKTYTIPWIHQWLRRRFKLDASANQFKTRLARHYDVDMDSGLKKALKRACRYI